MSFIVGVTGPSGAGKSVACRKAQSLGFQVIDCDCVAHDVIERDRECKAVLVAAFTEEILSGGKIDRAKLASAAFKNPEQTALLNDTALPYIVKAIKGQMKGELILLDAPTLIQSGVNSECSVVIGVLSSDKMRRERILSRDNITKEKATERMNAAPKDAFFIENCDYIVYNNGEQEHFCEQFKDLLSNILEGRKIK